MAVNVLGGALEFDAVINNSAFKRQINEMELKINGLTDSMRKEAKEMDSLLSKTTAVLAGYASFTAAGSFIRDIVRTRGEFQQLEVAFTTMLQSKEKADQLMAEAVRLAAITPFSLQEVAQGAKQLLAYGFAAEDTTKNLTTLGNIAAGVSQPLGDIVYLYGTLRAQGRAYSVDIRQFASRGIPIYEELAKVLGVAQNEVLGLVEAGKVGFPEVEKAFQNLTTEGRKFFNLMEEQSKTLTGLRARLGDAWQVMLNDIGRSNEGVFASTIKGAISLVENYETVLDVLKVLIATYGTYRAAIIATAVAQNFATTAAKGYTIAETLRYQAMLLSERVMKLLNATMLSNPFVAGATAIAAFVSVLVLLNKESARVKLASDLVAEAQERTSETFKDQEATVRALVAQISQANVSETDRLRIYKDLKNINPILVDGIDQQNIAIDALRKNVDKYIESLREQYRVQANEDAIKASIKQEQEFEKIIKQRTESIKTLEDLEKRGINGTLNTGPSLAPLSSSATEREKLREELLLLQQQQDQTKKLGGERTKLTDTTGPLIEKEKVTVAILQEKVKKLKEEQEATSESSAQWNQYQKQIDAVQKQIEAITGKKTTKEMAKELKERERDMESFIKALADAEADARQSGLVKEESELDKINTRYDELLAKARELGAGAGFEQRIEAARKTQTGNTKIKQEVEEYLKSLSTQEEAFKKYEDAKVEYGEANAKEMYGELTDDFDSYVAYLENEIAKAFANRNTYEGQLKLQGLGKKYVEADKEAELLRIEQEQKNFDSAIERSQTFNSQKLKLEKKYQEERAALEKSYIGTDLNERLQKLKALHELEIAEVDNAAARQSVIYQKLNEDIIRFTREQLKTRVADLKQTLLTDASLTPQMRADIQSYIDQIEDLIRATGKGATAARNLNELANVAGQIGSAISSAAGNMRGFSEEVPEALEGMSTGLNLMNQLASAAASFASGNIVGGIAGAIASMGTVFGLLGKNREDRKREEAEAKAFQQEIRQGEAEINALYRERQREQVKINELRLQGLREEKDLLQRQTSEIQAELNKRLAELQQESFEKGFTEMLTARGVEQVMQFGSLAGKTLQEIEELSIKGQLTDDAEGLFQIVKALNEELDAAKDRTAENARELQEALTGTTAETITDTIARGFADGKRAVSDFADDTEDIIRGAMLNALKYQVLQEPIKKLYEQFAKDAEDNGGLDFEEVQGFTTAINKTIEDARKFAEQVEQATGVNLSDAQRDNSNSMAGAIKGITEQQADLLAGQFNGLRITAMEQLSVATNSLSVLNGIKSDTAFLRTMDAKLNDIINRGIPVRP